MQRSGGATTRQAKPRITTRRRLTITEMPGKGRIRGTAYALIGPGCAGSARPGRSARSPRSCGLVQGSAERHAAAP
jgi:hypothetical protein